MLEQKMPHIFNDSDVHISAGTNTAYDVMKFS